MIIQLIFDSFSYKNIKESNQICGNNSIYNYIKLIDKIHNKKGKIKNIISICETFLKILKFFL